jgi:UDP-3-O-[3-hydroxymyristoyl] N-acetylglucosamine deacetylase/3-hydroxyacyl-[acyl-carrier-protein] dehydratase
MAMVPPAVTPKGGEVMDVTDVMKLLPHRPPVPHGRPHRGW